ncbi:hypothetical protein DIPPA_33352 [Diplonema papillatum]|nr:hypothetical protein DIPPA_33352 [Diplonema papillatum]
MSEMRYGNGGFMVDGAARASSSSSSVAACVAEDTEFMTSAEPMPAPGQSRSSSRGRAAPV